MEHVSSWLRENWLGVLGVVVGVLIPLALRSPSRLRYWVVPNRPYLFGAVRTKLNLRNIGPQPIEADQWRAPLSVKCGNEITGIRAVGVSYQDIKVTAEIMDDNQNEAALHISRLDPGDEVAFEIRHEKARVPPQLKGEVRGAPESFTQGLTLIQRLETLLPILFLLSLQYIGLAAIVWLIDLRKGTGGAPEGILFILASPLVEIVIALAFYRAAALRHRKPMYRPEMGHLSVREIRHPKWLYNRSQLFKLVNWITIGNLALLPPALLVAWLAGYRLWYPQFAIFAGVLWLLVRVVTRQPYSSSFGVSASPRQGSFPELLAAAALLVDAIGSAVFAWAVAAGVKSSALIFIGLLYALAFAISRMDIDWMRRRLPSVLGNPRGRFLEPPQDNP